MAKEFKFVDLNKQLLPQTKGKNLNGVRFYNVDGKNYHQSHLFYQSENQKVLKDGVKVLTKALTLKWTSGR